MRLVLEEEITLMIVRPKIVVQDEILDTLLLFSLGLLLTLHGYGEVGIGRELDGLGLKDSLAL